jgi:hypothetical protein
MDVAVAIAIGEALVKDKTAATAIVMTLFEEPVIAFTVMACTVMALSVMAVIKIGVTAVAFTL